MKIAVVTTFPLSYYELCAREMLITFDRYWPKDVELFIALDKVTKEQLEAIQIDLNNVLTSGREFYISNEWSPEKEAFYKRNTDSPDVSYRFHVCRFGHKVFALYNTVQHLKQTGGDMLIWLDADVITHKEITHEILEKELLPKSGDFVSYLGRTDAPHSECSFVAYTKTGFEIIEKMHDIYITDKVLELPGWTDCDVFDAVVKDYGKTNLSEGIKGWHVFPLSPCGKYMEHRKGARKHKSMPPSNQPIQTETMQIKTKNCLPNEQILANVQENMKYINNWVRYVKPHDEKVVICSAGESLSYLQVKAWHDKGVKIVAVKHAIERLKKWGIKPWACVLLDPRPHVEKFVDNPDRDVIYFVASMVDPSVVRTLLDNKCIVVGYHAFVGAGEDKLLPAGTMLVSGGSATATRSIGLLHECLGFKDVHCYGYDLCYHTRPDMTIKNEDGQPKYLEVNLSANAWGGKPQTRTFWTEGQFLAQAKELHDLYKTDLGVNITIYGQGIAAWQQDCFKQYKAWHDKFNRDIETQKQSSQTLDEWQNAITGKSNRPKLPTITRRDGILTGTTHSDW